MGALVTLDLQADAPQLELPWIITFGPLDEDEDWEPVVCGPYERPHALALAQHIVADAELMAVVEPLLPATSLEQIRAEIEAAQRSAPEVDAELDDTIDDDLGDLADLHVSDLDDHDMAPATPPTADELKAGFERIAARLTAA